MNHGGLRSVPVQYIVVHYTGTPNDTAENEGLYFNRNDTGKTSAHYFVDEKEVVQSVLDEYVAYHCGGATYFHDKCRNGNSIGVEICTKRSADGKYYFHPDAVARAQELVRDLMDKYNVPQENVVRHFDVTHKLCPMPFVGEGQPLWEEFKGGLVMYKTMENVPDWAKSTVQKLVDAGHLQGDQNGDLNLTHDMTRVLVVLDRAKVFEK
jgi:N-acetylmuramoyl-L-alanine amidase